MAEEKRLVTSGELQKREDTVVDLTNFKDRLEQLLDKKPGEVVIHIDDDEGEEGEGSDARELLKAQRTMRNEQDQHLDSLSQTISRQKNLGMMISEELDLQSDLLDDLDSDLDRTKGKMSKTMKTLDKVGKNAKSRKGVIVIVGLIVVIVLGVILGTVLHKVA